MALLLGVIVGAVLGLTGAGGSILASPLLMAGLGWSLPQTEPVALLAVCAAATFGTIVAWDVTYIRWRAALLMAGASFVTVPFGVKAAWMMPVDALTVVFAAVLALVGVRMAWQARVKPDEAAVVRATVSGDALPARGGWVRLTDKGRIAWDVRAASALALIGAGTGFVAGLLGVGGGFIIVPALRYVSALSMHSAIATSLMVIALTSAAAVAATLTQGFPIAWPVALPFVAGALVGMLVGRKVAPRIAGPRLQQGFAVAMLVTAVGLAVHILL